MTNKLVSMCRDDNAWINGHTGIPQDNAYVACRHYANTYNNYWKACKDDNI